MSLEDNPFLNLFNSLEDARTLINKMSLKLPPENIILVNATKETNLITQIEVAATEDFFSFLEDIFLLSRTENTVNQFCLSAFKDMSQEKISKNDLSILVHERLLAKEELVNVLKEKPRLAKSQAYEIDPMKYLAECHARLQSKSDEKDLKLDDYATTCSSIIKEQAILLLEVPNQLEDFSPTNHLLSLLRSNVVIVTENLSFYAQLVDQMKDNGITWLLEQFQPLLDDLLTEVEGYKGSLESSFSAERFRFPAFLDFFTRNETLAIMFLEYDRRLIRQRASFEKSLLGNLLTLGPSPKFFSVLSDYLDNPRSIAQSTIDDLESQVYKFMDEIQLGVYNIFHKLLKFKNEVKKALLLWIGDALHSYKDRNKLWNTHHLIPTISADNFLINLQNIFFKAFKPFLEDHSKLLDIQPTYCWATNKREEALRRNVHMREIQETYLVPSDSGVGSSSAPPSPSSSAPSLEDDYKMSSEIFFMTHCCFNLGFSVIHEKFTKLSQEMGQIRERYQELLNQGLGGTEAGLALKDQLQIALPLFYSCKTALMQPHLLEKSFQFMVLTANFLVHAAMTPQCSSNSSNVNKAKFPPPSDASGASLKCIPEFVVHNLHSYLMFLRRTKDNFFENQSQHLGSLLDFILLFMSNPRFIHNPHTRAEMAEALECLFPRVEQLNVNSLFSPVKLENYNREKLLVENANARHATACIIKLFVGMELTGQGVNFENKFRYRQPIYVMFKYLWGVQLHKNALMDLVKYAENHLEDVDAPLFLRFINLLVNDAIYLLDEALNLMTQIREKAPQRESNWSDFPANQRQELEASYNHITKLARFHNIMGLETITTLANLTGFIHSIFTHPVMVDRLAAMLNYFLLHLVGPKQVNLKVKNPEEFKFEPRKLVLEICRIYENFSENEEFLRAVSRDGRSYSRDLFCQASDVLAKIKESYVRIDRFNKIASRINELARVEAEEDEVDIPDEFIDPIMGTLMRDPVLLPGSKKVVDRQTIARHVLSDQSDPFSRQPLTMNMITPDDDLRIRIEEWLAEHRKR